MSANSRLTMMLLAFPTLLACSTGAKHESAAPSESTVAITAPVFEQHVVATGLTSPHAMLWGPDDQIWMTERTIGRISRLDPATGTRTDLFTVPDFIHTEGSQDGLLGFVLHPGFGNSKGGGSDYVYVSLTTKADARSPQKSGQTLIRRYTWDGAANTLTEPKDLLSGLPHSVDHQSGRLVFGADGRLYYTIGDQGANQLANYCRPNRAQDLPTATQVAARDWSTFEGKILRLEPDGTIPADNPTLNGVRSYIYAYGFRNAQGLAFASDGSLYQTEQGPKTDDEVNRIIAGGNYGWPNVSGFRDDKNYVYANWSRPKGVACETLTFSNYEIPDALTSLAESSFVADIIEPLKTFYTVEPGHNFKDPVCAEGEYWNTCWPTIAASSLAVYESDAIPGWNRSLLVPALKDGKVFRVALDDQGSARVGEAEALFETTNRYRDVLVSRDGRSFYVATDSAGPTKGVTGAKTEVLENPGAILVFTVQP